jgi:precorrin-6B methylase 2
MGSKPVAEGGHKGWIGGQILNGFARANSAPNEVTMEELHSELRVIANFSALKMRASATSKMAVKGIKYVEIDVAQNIASPLNETAEMGGGSNISNRAG